MADEPPVEPTVEPTVEPSWNELQTPRDVLSRIRWIAVGAWLVFAVFLAFSGGFRAVLGLTCSAAVTMIAFLWLEEIVNTLLQPAAHRHARRMTLRTLARFALLGVALTVTIIIARFNASSVLLGFSIIVVGICGEALYSLIRSSAARG
jgi:hypothetical protein